MIGAALVSGVGVLLAAGLSSAKRAGRVIKLAVESADRALLGVDITVANAVLSISHGMVEISGLKVHNPDKHQWASPYLARVDHVKVDVDVMRAIKSKGQEIEITSLVLEGVDVCYDVPSIGESSNVNMVVDFVGAPAPEPSSTSTSAAAEPQVIVREIIIKGVGAGAYISGHKVAAAQLGDIVFDDFAKKLDKEGGAVVGDVIQVILTTILNTVLSNHEIMAEAARATGSAALKGVSSSLAKSLAEGSAALTNASRAVAGGSLFSTTSFQLGGASQTQQGDSLYRDVVFGGRTVEPAQYRKVVFGASAEAQTSTASIFSTMSNPFAAQAGGSSMFSTMLGGGSQTKQGDSLYRQVVFGGRTVEPAQYRKVVFGASAEACGSGFFSAMSSK